MNVSITCDEPGMWTVRRGLETYDGRLSLLERNIGWEVVFAGNGGFGRVVTAFDKFGDARTWLNSDDGQAWLDGLPRKDKA